MKTEELRARVRHGLIEYGINVVYLTLVFAAFTEYRRLLLAAHDITYTNYWVALVEALILGKVIMIGAVLRLGRSLETKPLIFPTLYKTTVFTFLCALFTVVLNGAKGLWHGIGFGGGLAVLTAKGSENLLADSLALFAALIPFFALKELGRVLGEKRVWSLFFRTRGES